VEWLKAKAPVLQKKKKAGGAVIFERACDVENQNGQRA
jgi:hypothetical protein